MKKYVGYLGYLLAIIAGARNETGLTVIVIAFSMTLFFARNRSVVDSGRPTAGKPNVFLDGVYFFGVQLLIVFVAYLLGYFITSGGGEMFGMWIREEVLRIPSEG